LSVKDFKNLDQDAEQGRWDEQRGGRDYV